MAVYAICDECDREYRLDDSLVGKLIRCKSCGAMVAVPSLAKPPDFPPADNPQPVVDVSDNYQTHRPQTAPIRWRVVFAAFGALVLLVARIIVGGLYAERVAAEHKKQMRAEMAEADRVWREKQEQRREFDEKLFDDIEMPKPGPFPRGPLRPEDLVPKVPPDPNEGRLDIPPAAPTVVAEPPMMPGVAAPEVAAADRHGKRIARTATISLDATTLGGGFAVARDAYVFVVGGNTTHVWRDDNWTSCQTGGMLLAQTEVMDLSANGELAILRTTGLNPNLSTLDTRTKQLSVLAKGTMTGTYAALKLSDDARRFVAMHASGRIEAYELPLRQTGHWVVPGQIVHPAIGVSADGRTMVIKSGTSLHVFGTDTGSTTVPGGNAAIAVDAGRILIGGTLDGLCLVDLKGNVLATLPNVFADRARPGFERQSMVGINRSGTLGCVQSGRRTVIVALEQNVIRKLGELQVEGTPVCGRFTKNGHLAVLVSDRMGFSEFHIETFDVSQ